jgi:hypothetical protein
MKPKNSKQMKEMLTTKKGKIPVLSKLVVCYYKVRKESFVSRNIFFRKMLFTLAELLSTKTVFLKKR